MPRDLSRPEKQLSGMLGRSSGLIARLTLRAQSRLADQATKSRIGAKINKAVLCCDSEDVSSSRGRQAYGRGRRNSLPRPFAKRSENLDRALQRLPHAPGERDADEGPE